MLVGFDTKAEASACSVTGHITQVWLGNTGNGLRVSLDAPVPNCAGCGDTSILMYYASSGPDASRFFAGVMTAFALGKQVSFWISSCTSPGEWGATHPIMDEIWVNN